MKQQFNFAMQRIFWCFILIAIFSTASIAQDVNDKLPKDPHLVIGKLANGLTYYIRTNHKPENKVELRLVVNAGSILEEDDQQGLAHFMEHMNFNGTKHFEKNDLVNYLQSIGVQFGADLNAYTSFDQTVYILPIPLDKSDNLEKGFQIIEDWAHNALLTDKDIDDERGVVLEESRLGKGAEDRMFKKYFPKLTEGTAYADRLPIGKDDVLKKFKYEKVKNFYNDWYRPNLQAVIVVGDIDTVKAKKMIMDHFDYIKNPAPEKRRKYENVKPRREPDAMVVNDKEAMNTMLGLIYPYQKKHDYVTLNDYRYNIIKNIALTIINHRLNDVAQGPNPPFPYAWAYFDDMIHGFESIQIYAGFTKSGPDSSLNTIVAEILKLKKFGINAPELEIAKKEFMSGMEKSYNERNTTESKNYAEECIRNFLDKEPIPGIENEYSYYKTFIPGIEVTEVSNMVKNWFTSKNTFTLISGPDRIDVELPKSTDLKDMTEAAFKQNVNQVQAKKVSASIMEKKPTPGKVVSQVKEDGFDATTYTLSNGIKVTIKATDFKSDEILMNGVKKGGTNNYELEDRNSAHFATDVVESMGFGDFTPSDLEKTLAGRNISTNFSLTEYSNQIKASSNIKDFETMLQVVNLKLTSPRRDEALFNSYKTKQKTQLEFLTSNPRLAFVDTTFKMLYDNNPMARMVIPKPADIDKINMDRSLEIYRGEFSSADGYHFFLSGNIKPETAIPLIETYIGSLPSFKRTPSYKDNGVRSKKGSHEFVFNKGKEKQSFIFVVYAGQTTYSEDFAMNVQALAEILNIKVIEDLREKLGGIYAGGYNGNVSKEPFERYSLVLQLPCGPENVEKLMNAAGAEIDTLKNSGPMPKDIDKVKSQWKEKHIISVKENNYWTEKMESVLFWGRNKDRIINYDNYIDKLSTNDIQETAKKIFNGENRFISVLNPE